MSACSPSSENTFTPTITQQILPQPDERIQKTESPSPLVTEESSTTPQHNCADKSGQIIMDTLEDSRLSRPMPYRIYLPPCYDHGIENGYPTIYLLHGLQRTDSQWDDLGVDEIAVELFSKRQLSQFLIVMPWERTGLELESAVVEVLLPHIEQTYNASPIREARAIGGISRGAGWALRIGLKHPELFRAIGLHSPAILSPDLFKIPEWVKLIPTGYQPLIWIDIGAKDTLLSPTLELKALLDELQVPYEWSLGTGYHEESYWLSHMPQYLLWYSDVFALVAPSADVQ